MFDYQRIIDRYYPADSPLRDIYLRHCHSVCNLALETARRHAMSLLPEQIEAAAMLHDIGIVFTDAPGIHCYGKAPYLTHGMLGANLLRAEGAPEYLARVAERHTGAGLTPEDVTTINNTLNQKGISDEFLLPSDRIYMPESLLEKVICYADKFYSKSGDMERKPLERVRVSIAKFGDSSLMRFDQLYAMLK